MNSSYTLPTGFFNIRSSVGGSVASARAPRVSMIKFTHNSCKCPKKQSEPEHKRKIWILDHQQSKM
jgi:hypothetical protein